MFNHVAIVTENRCFGFTICLNTEIGFHLSQTFPCAHISAANSGRFPILISNTSKSQRTWCQSSFCGNSRVKKEMAFSPHGLNCLLPSQTIPLKDRTLWNQYLVPLREAPCSENMFWQNIASNPLTKRFLLVVVPCQYRPDRQLNSSCRHGNSIVIGNLLSPKPPRWQTNLFDLVNVVWVACCILVQWVTPKLSLRKNWSLHTGSLSRVF